MGEKALEPAIKFITKKFPNIDTKVTHYLSGMDMYGSTDVCFFFFFFFFFVFCLFVCCCCCCFWGGGWRGIFFLPFLYVTLFLKFISRLRTALFKVCCDSSYSYLWANKVIVFHYMFQLPPSQYLPLHVHTFFTLSHSLCHTK